MDLDLGRISDFTEKAYWWRLSMCSKRRSSKGSSRRAMRKTGDLTEERAMMDGWLMAQVRASTVQQEREEVHAALQCAAMLSLTGGRVERL